jgi:hypothetical protein
MENALLIGIAVGFAPDPTRRSNAVSTLAAGGTFRSPERAVFQG